jgi:hypothetical protein
MANSELSVTQRKSSGRTVRARVCSIRFPNSQFTISAYSSGERRQEADAR